MIGHSSISGHRIVSLYKMDDRLAVAVYVCKCMTPRLLRILASRYYRDVCRVHLNGWTTVVTNKAVFVLEIANLIEIIGRIGIHDQIYGNEKENGVLLWVMIGILGAILAICIGIVLKLRSDEQSLYFPFCKIERNLEIVGYFWLHVLTCIITLSNISTLVSSGLILYITLIVCIREESSNAIKYREQYIEFWYQSPSNLIFIDRALEMIFRLKGLIPIRKKCRNYLVKAWPTLFYA